TMRRHHVLGLLVLCAAAACSDIETRRRDWSTYDGPGAKYFHEEQIVLPMGFRDPVQPLNRGLFAANDWLVTWIIDPISTGWRFVFPKTVREHIGKAGTNLAYPTRVLNDLAQGEGGEAGRRPRASGSTPPWGCCASSTRPNPGASRPRTPRTTG